MNPTSLEAKIQAKLHLLSPTQQQTILSFIEFLLSRFDRQESDDKQQMFLETCGAWQDDPRTAEELVEEIYSARTTSDRGYSL